MTNQGLGVRLLLGAAVLLAGACGSEADDASGYAGAAGVGASGSGGAASGGEAGAGVGGFGAGGAGGAGVGGSGPSPAGGSGGAGAVGGSCNDPGPEPNDTLPKATPVCSPAPCTIGCSDSAGGDFTGVLSPGDVDLFTYFGEDKVTCTVNAEASTLDSGFRLCIFAQCGGGKPTTITGCKKGTLTPGPGELQGCCAQAPAAVEIDHDCPGLTDDDSAAVTMQVDQASACIGYTVAYHF